MSYERFRDWLEEALDDLEAARELFQFGRWSKVCFLSHQAVEKALKALCIKRLGVYSQTHSIAKLIEDVRGVIVIPEELAELGSLIDTISPPGTLMCGLPYLLIDIIVGVMLRRL